MRKKGLEVFLLPRHAGSLRGSGGEGIQVGASDAQCGQTNVLPVLVGEHRSVFISDRAPHGGPGCVACRNTDVGVGLTVCFGPKDRLGIVGRTGDRPRVIERRRRRDLRSRLVRAQG